MLTLRGMNLDKLNSITKYPSIPTYHTLGVDGILLPDHIDFAGFDKVEGKHLVLRLAWDEPLDSRSVSELLNPPVEKT